MSLVLKAFPLGFLINRDFSEDEIVRRDLRFEQENLCLIKVATNLRLEDVNYLMENLGISCKYKNDKYFLGNGLCVQWTSYQGYYSAFISAIDKKVLFGNKNKPVINLAKQGELLFKTFDVILKRNTRDVNSKEIFYYCYKTDFKARYEVIESLKQHNIENIIVNTENEIRFKYNNKNYKFKRESNKDLFYIESEQRISLVDIVSGGKHIRSKAVKTNYTNKDILIKTLAEHGANALQSDDYNIYCELSGMQFMFSRNNTKSAYNLEIDKIVSEEICNNLLKDLADEYGLNIQDVVYKRIMERIQTQNMRIENEEVSEDNTIVLTIDLG